MNQVSQFEKSNNLIIETFTNSFETINKKISDIESILSNEERTKSGRKITNSKRKRKSSKLLQNEIPVEVGEVVKHDDVAPQEVNNEDKEPVVQDDEGIVQKLKKLILK